MGFREWFFSSRLWNRFGKNVREEHYWKSNIDRMIKWYEGKEEWRFPCLKEDQKERRFDLKKNAIITYINIETEHASYFKDLWLTSNSFSGKRVADMGSGPLPTLLVFKDCERYCLDHLIDAYRKMGYPLDEYEKDIHFVNCKSEKLPFDDDFFDVIISRNALDHVDSFENTGLEIKRVLRSGGILHLLLNYHKPTKTETQSLSDRKVVQAFGDFGITKVFESQGAWGFSEGKTVLWSTMDRQDLRNE